MAILKISSLLRLCLGASALVFSSMVRADVTLPSLLSDHMILQRSTATALWGKAAPGEKVRVALGEIRAETVTGADGRWKVELDLSTAKEGPLKCRWRE